MSKQSLSAILMISALAGACAGAPAPEGKPAAAVVLGPRERMRKILSSPPDLAWEVSRLQQGGDYWHAQGDENGSGFFLSRAGFHYSENGAFAMRYERTAHGFKLLELKRRSGRQPLPQCPVYLPAERCIEEHELMLVTLISCESSCSYHFAVIDFHGPLQALSPGPSVASLMRQLFNDWLPLPGIEIKFEESGVVFDADEAWASYIAERFAFIADQVRSAQASSGLTLHNPLSW